jgi:hypothetical protein
MTLIFRPQIQAVRDDGIAGAAASIFAGQPAIGGDKSLGYNRIVEEEVSVPYA